jgi:hypothetical protein
VHRRRGLSHFRLCVAISAAFMVGILLNSWSILLPMDQALYQWSLKGCPAKILELTTTMAATHKVRMSAAQFKLWAHNQPCAGLHPSCIQVSADVVAPIALPAVACLVRRRLKGALRVTLTPSVRRISLQSAVAAGLDPELGNPTLRKPKTAIVNFVRCVHFCVASSCSCCTGWHCRMGHSCCSGYGGGRRPWCPHA